MIRILDLSLYEYLNVIYRANYYHSPLCEKDEVALRQRIRHDRYLSVMEVAYGEDDKDIGTLLDASTLKNDLKAIPYLSKHDHKGIMSLAAMLRSIDKISIIMATQGLPIVYILRII